MDDIERRIEELSLEGRALMREVERDAEKAREGAATEEEVADLNERMAALFVEHPEDQENFLAILEAEAARRWEVGHRLKAEGAKYEGLSKIILQARELDRRAGRPLNERMTLGEAVSKLEAAGELDPLERKYLESIKDEVIYVPLHDADDAD